MTDPPTAADDERLVALGRIIDAARARVASPAPVVIVRPSPDENVAAFGRALPGCEVRAVLAVEGRWLPRTPTAVVLTVIPTLVIRSVIGSGLGWLAFVFVPMTVWAPLTLHSRRRDPPPTGAAAQLLGRHGVGWLAATSTGPAATTDGRTPALARITWLEAEVVAADRGLDLVCPDGSRCRVRPRSGDAAAFLSAC